MPGFVAYAAATYLGYGATAAMLISTAVTMAYSAIQASSQKRKQRDAQNAAQVDRFAMLAQTVMERHLVLGRVRKGGAVFFRGATGNNSDIFVVGQAIAGHTIANIEAVFLADVRVTLDADGWVLDEPYNKVKKVDASFEVPGLTHTVTLEKPAIPGSVHAVIPAGFDSGNSDAEFPTSLSPDGLTVTILGDALAPLLVRYQYAETDSSVRIWWEFGDPNAVADARMLELFPGVWTPEHRGRGVAKVFGLFKYNETAFPNGVPAITVQVAGANCYDPRTGTSYFTENPALHMRHVYQHPWFGKAAISSAEEARFAAAANVCDTNHGYVVNGVTTNVPMYRSAIVAPYGTAAKDVFDDLMQAMGGMWAYGAGELYLRPGVYTASVRSFYDADLATVTRRGETKTQNQISISPHRERARKFNTVNIRIWDAAQGYKIAPITPLKSDALIARDGKPLSDEEVTMAAVFFAPQAQHIAGVMMRDARDPFTVRLPFKLRAYPVEIFDTIDMTRSRNGWVGKTFMVIEREWDHTNGIIWLTLKETAAAIFQPDASFKSQGYAVNTTLPRPWDISPPVLRAIFSGTSELISQPGGGLLTGVRVVWDAVTDPSIAQAGFVEVGWSAATSTLWTTVRVEGGATQAVLIGPVDGTVILIKLRTRNSVAVSDWSVTEAHPVVGKREPPPSVTGVALSVDRVFFAELPRLVVPDLDGYQIRAVPGTVPQWSLAVPLHQGLVTDSPWLIPQALYGVQTVMVAAVDTSGNVGGIGAGSYATQDFGLPDTSTSIQGVDFCALGWPGFVTNATGAAGAPLVADADPAADFWTIGGEDFWTRDNATDFWGGSVYLPMSYVFTFAPMYGGGQILLDMDPAPSGSRVTIETRVDGTMLGDFWEGNGGAGGLVDFWSGDSFWGDSGEWQPWLGSAISVRSRGVQFRISVDGGPQQGILPALSAHLVMELVSQVFGLRTIAAGGTRLPPADGIPPRNWISLVDATPTPFNDGSGAISGRNRNFDPVLGPLVELVDITGAAVTGQGTATVLGYEDATF